MRYSLMSFFALTSGALIALSGCSSKDEGKTSVQIQLPDFAAAAAKQAQSADAVHAKASSKKLDDVSVSTVQTRISRVVLNVSGSTDIVQIWQRKDDSSVAPLEFNVSLKSGAEAVVQIMAIVEQQDSNTGVKQQVFFYGEAAKSIATGKDSVDLSVTSEGSSTGEGKIAGRFLQAENFGPTDAVDLIFNPKSGRKGMIVATMGIYNGWFQFFAPSSMSFSYVAHDGTVLFKNMNINSPSLLTGDGRTLFAHRPSAYKSNGNSREVSDARQAVVGFYGPASAGRKVCYQNAAGTYDELYTSSTTTVMDKLPWAGTSSDLTVAGVNSGGGVGDATGNCGGSGDANNQSYLKFAYQRLTYGDGVFRFRGPFAAVGSGTMDNTYIGTTALANTIRLNYSFVPGVAGKGIAGAGLFVRKLLIPSSNDSDPEYQLDDGYDCNNLTNASIYKNPFVQVARIPAVVNPVATSEAPQQYDLAGYTATDVSAGLVEMVLCPYKDSTTYLTDGVVLRGGSNGNGNNNNSNVEDLSLTLSANNILEGDCTTLNINNVKNGSPFPASLAFAANLYGQQSLRLNGGSGNFVVSCSDSTSVNTVNFAIGDTVKTVGFRTSANGSYRLMAQRNDSHPVTRMALLAVGRTITETGTIDSIAPRILDGVAMPQTSVVNALCYPVLFAKSRTTTADQAAGVSPYLANSSTTSVTYNISVTDGMSNSTGTFYTDSTCSGSTTSSFTLAQGQFIAGLYFKPILMNGQSASATMNVAVSGTPWGSLNYSLAPAVIAAYPVERLDGQAMWASLSDCVALRVRAVATNGATVPVTASTSANFSVNNATLYSDVSCQTLKSSATIDPGSPNSTSEVVYGKITSVGEGQIITTANSIPTITYLSSYPDTSGTAWKIAQAVVGDTRLMPGVCQPFTFTVNRNNAIMLANSALGVRLTTSSQNLVIYSDAGCLMPSPTVIFPAQTNATQTIYIKGTGIGGDNYYVTAVATNFTFTFASQKTFGMTPSFDLKSATSGVTKNPNDCVEVTPRLWFNGMGTSSGPPLDISINSVSVVDFSNFSTGNLSTKLFSDAACTANYPNLVGFKIPASQSSPSSLLYSGNPAAIYVKLNSTLSTYASQVQLNYSIGSTPSGSSPNVGPTSCASLHCFW